MPIRKIPLRYSSLSGIKPSTKNSGKTQFESSLEADFIDLLEWDWRVKFYEEQPYKIEFLDESQKLRFYIPDFFVRFHENSDSDGLTLNPTINEVKYSKDLELHKQVLNPKFAAAKTFCLEQGFEFKIITEKEIRTPNLENVRFLKRYRKQEVHIPMMDYLKSLLEKFEVTTPEILIASTSQVEEKRAMFLSVLWVMVSNGSIMIDMTKKITMNSKIWIPL